MTIELVGLAYDQALTDTIWKGVTANQAYALILEDEFRRKVDLRSLLYHKGHADLLSNIGAFIKQGGHDCSLVDLIARRFAKGIEEFPSHIDDLAFDFQLIRHFSSLAMVDDFLVADAFLRELLRNIGFLQNGAGWSLVEVRDFSNVITALQDVRMKDIQEASKSVAADKEEISPEQLVRNYIEFLNYSNNNGLRPFFYNSQADFRHWGDLAERKNSRSELIVDLSMKGPPAEKGSDVSSFSEVERDTMRKRARVHRERESLLLGLKDLDPLIRQKAAESLGLLADQKTLPDLVEALYDNEEEVRQEIIRAIGQVGGPKSERALLDLFDQDDSASVRMIAAFYLCKMNSTEVISKMLNELEKGSLQFSILLSMHPSFVKHRSAVPELQKLYQSDRADIRQEAAFLMGCFPAKKTGSFLDQLLKDDDANVRATGVYALQRQNAKEVTSHCADLTKDSSEQVRQALLFVGKK